MRKIVFLLLLVGGILVAKDFALIVAIGDYNDDDFDLNQTQISADIELYKRILKEKKGVSDTDIELLRDKRATWVNIKDYLEKVIKEKKGTYRFFMFFTGHGLDKNRYSEIQNELKNTGAILPYDFNPFNVRDTIITGKDHLKKYFQKIDENARENPLIIFDACFAKNLIKDEKSRKDETPFVYTDTISNDYKYTNITYIGASTNKAKQGKLTKVLNNCLFELNGSVDNIKSCLNNHDSGAGQFVFLKN